MAPDARYEILVIRYGALGLAEQREQLSGQTREEIEKMLTLHMDTLCPLDTAEIKIGRERP
jgi:hypothetical protein